MRRTNCRVGGRWPPLIPRQLVLFRSMESIGKTRGNRWSSSVWDPLVLIHYFNRLMDVLAKIESQQTAWATDKLIPENESFYDQTSESHIVFFERSPVAARLVLVPGRRGCWVMAVVGRPTIGCWAAGKHAVVLHRSTASNPPRSPEIRGKRNEYLEATGPLLFGAVVPVSLAVQFERLAPPKFKGKAKLIKRCIKAS